MDSLLKTIAVDIYLILFPSPGPSPPSPYQHTTFGSANAYVTERGGGASMRFIQTRIAFPSLAVVNSLFRVISMPKPENWKEYPTQHRTAAAALPLPPPPSSLIFRISHRTGP